ncbi:MAG: hypothetical protein GXY65_00240 [Rhodococcus sp.]|uniref:hypothetical protein n=1 Tax=Rhodococcus sp. TaxID=1831 RepID=UPI00168E9B9C|nr:hypothetical protein [Rhodococcus sp. (in: high G+C Gram-positive bacteria)]NLV77779.1 hypothetical protein [Rhodococcus sp. (in: high G+C Gram-positive bacteria)]
MNTTTDAADSTTVDTTTEQDSTTPEPATEHTPEHTPEPNGNAEAAKYRKQLRAAEKDRDTALEQVDALRRDIIDDLIEREHKIKPAAFWANGNTVDALLGDDGRIDRAAVATAADAAIHALGLHPPLGVFVPNEGSNPNVTVNPTWASVINPHSKP